MKLRWLSHSAFELTFNNLNILIDPFIRGNPSCPLNVSELHPDIICITHGHADHFGDAVEISQNNPNAIVITNYEISAYLQQKGVNAVGLNYGASVEIGDVNVKALEAKHSSSFDFKPDFKYAGNPLSFLISDGEVNVFHAGDTGLFSDMKFVIGEIYKPDIALLPIGNIFTMDITEAAVAASWINPKIVIPMHYNSFDSIKQNTEEFKRLVSEKSPNTKTLIPEVLEILEF